MRKIETITRKAYRARIYMGERYRNAAPYEPTIAAPDVYFVNVMVTDTYKQLKRRIGCAR